MISSHAFTQTITLLQAEPAFTYRLQTWPQTVILHKTGENTVMKDALPYYNVGPLLYCPANNPAIVHSLPENRFGTHFSMALCLEDTINDDCVAEAEEMLIRNLQTLCRLHATTPFFLPDFFIRVRNPQQITDLTKRLEEAHDLVKGYILPKFSPDSADTYIEAALDIQQTYHCHKYIMPILESPILLHPGHRTDILCTLKDRLDAVSDLVLNIRVGGNDLCNVLGFRRSVSQSIHRIHTVAQVFSDIIAIYGPDYVISGPVWEYYGGSGWDDGLRRELQEDRLCGFIGKTVIHPRQIPLVNEAYRVSPADLEDAHAILGWDISDPSFVRGSAAGARMNEKKTHYNWALQTLMLSRAYGVSES